MLSMFLTTCPHTQETAIRYDGLCNHQIQCPLINRIILAQHKNDNINRMIQLIDVFCALFKYNGTSSIWLQ